MLRKRKVKEGFKDYDRIREDGDFITNLEKHALDDDGQNLKDF